MVIVLSDASCRVRVDSRHGHREVTGPALVVAPPGRSEVTALTDGEVTRLLEATEIGWAERASNAADYTRPHPRVSPLHRWPEPPGPEQVRVYPLDEVPADPTRFGRIFRTRSFMVNFLLPNDGPRDPTKLSPHTHDDFEQISYAVTGEFVHHIRTPWGADRAQWVPDQHQAVGSPSVAIIPPPTVHTTEASGADRNWLVDIFSPPRADFSAKPRLGPQRLGLPCTRGHRVIGFRDLLDREQAPLGTWVKLPTVESVELMALAGFDFVVIDLEHSPMTLESAATLIAVARGRGTCPLVRVPDHSPAWIQRCLDAGASGILAPHVDTVDQAQSVARSARFEPAGTRVSAPPAGQATGGCGR